MSTKRHRWLGLLAIALFGVVFFVPFAFILFTAAKTQTEAGELQFSLPTTWALLQNFQDALAARDYMLVIAFINSIVLTVVSVTVLVVLASMVAYVAQRREPLERPGQLPGAGRAHHPTRGRPDRVGAPASGCSRP